MALEKRKKRFFDSKTRWMYLLMIPALAYFIVYRYLPMGGLVMVFQKYRIARGIFGSAWCGLDNFYKLFRSPVWPSVLKNTVIISFLKLLFNFPAPIIVALMLNEIHSRKLKRTLQTTLYLPHFLSWVVLGSLIFTLFAPSSGAVSKAVRPWGWEINWLTDPSQFRWLLVFSDIWKEVGWGTIVYLAAITSIDGQQYEAAIIDGANNWQKLWYITIPALLPTIMTMLLLRVGKILNVGFDQVFILQNSLVYDVSEIIDTYVYKLAFQQGQHAISAAAGLFKSVIGMIMVVCTNRLAKHFDQEVL